jgi:hypothetical protein
MSEKIITYNLNGKSNSIYYEDIRKFSEKILKDSGRDLSVIISDYVKYIVTKNREELRTYEEYLYDVLSAGVYLKVYSNIASSSSRSTDFILSGLFGLRKKNRFLKKYIDVIRGLLIALNYGKKNFNNNYIDKPDIRILKRVLLFLKASGEYREEVIRIQMFYDFLSSLENSTADNYLVNIVGFAIKFENKSENELGEYTSKVNEYLETGIKKHLWKEDFLFCGRRRVEYHLSMLGAELMNKAFDESYSQTRTKAILLPACMREKKDGECKAIKNDFAMTCTGCSLSCKVNKIQNAANIRDTKVYLIPHSSNFKEWLKLWAYGRNVGVVGVACPLNLIIGGLELKSLDIPAKCILLDYCGCKNHWDKKGIPTSVNESELIKSIGLYDEGKEYVHFKSEFSANQK